MELTTLKGVKELLEKEEGEEGAGEPSDELLKVVIKAASKQITDTAKREFVKSDGVERIFAHDGGCFLDLMPYDLRAVESIKIDVAGSVTELKATGYTLRPMPPRDGVYEWIKLATNPGASEIAIKGNWGFAAVPDDVEYFTRLTVVSWLRGDVFAYTPQLETPAPLMRRALPREVAMGLEDSYGRVTVA